MLRALQMFFAHKRLCSCTQTPQLKAHDLPFMNFILGNLNAHDFGDTSDASIHEQRLQNVLVLEL